jgi:ribA/ribD-fused uncharacterized protein
METLVTPEVIRVITEYIDIGKKDPKAEVECKLLSGLIQTKDVADRILKAVQSLAIGASVDENRMSLSYPDKTRVNVLTPQLIHKVCVQGSFKDIPVLVEKKESYFDRATGKKDTIDASEANARFSLRSERTLRKDWDGSPNDPKAHLRIMNRKSFKTGNELFRIDFSRVKTREMNSKKTMSAVLADEPTYELEIEFINKKTSVSNEVIVKELFKICTTVLQSYNESQFLLSNSDIQRYQQEFKMTSNIFFNPVTLKRRHLNPQNPHNIAQDYTVTVKADGERYGLYVARDKKVLLVNKNLKIKWTGITARNDSHVGDFLDGEYIPKNNIYSIFDMYRYKSRDLKALPLMTTDEQILKNPTKSRLGNARLFVEDLKTDFLTSPSAVPLRIETKMFLAGDGPAMEEAIKTILSTDFEYETDGLIFTPRSSGVAPLEDRVGKSWTKVYKWKPPHQNSIDFLLSLGDQETFDPVTGEKAKQGTLYIGQPAGDYIVYPRETLNGEYIPKKVPEELMSVSDANVYFPGIFQPAMPRDPEAYKIYVPIDTRGMAKDREGIMVEDKTIVECAFDTEKHRWEIMRTRYDKTYQYKVMRKAEYGNRVDVANDIWNSIHVPVSRTMIESFISNPIEVTDEDDSYYNDDVRRPSREFEDIRKFHNKIKHDLYRTNVTKGDTLLELASGRDIMKWKKVQPSKVVALDISLANIEAPNGGAAVRYIQDKRKNPQDYLPPVLFLQGDMTEYPLFEQEDKYMKILNGEQTAPTEYLSQFEGLVKFNVISCQFAMHYACQSEEIFRAYAKNIDKYGKDIFFGTCSDGPSIYSLLLGKKSHMFMANKHIIGEYTKEYIDKETWTEEFGMPVKVMLETFDKPITEWLVPFKKVTEIFQELGWDLVESKLFNDLYSQQTGSILTQEQQVFSFLNRAFIFKRGKKPKPAPEPVVEPVVEPVAEAVAEADVKEIVVAEKPKKRKLRIVEDEEEPVLFFGSDESKGEFRTFSNMSNHPIDIEGVKYPTVEHYFQAMKAKEFNDEEMYNKIVKTKTAKAVKAVGKKVKNFVQEVWDSKREAVMEKAIRAKFVQHPELRKQLLETGDKIIGFADPRNTFWGIGTGMESEKSKKPSKWRGQNKIGKILMALRTTLKDESI